MNDARISDKSVAFDQAIASRSTLIDYSRCVILLSIQEEEELVIQQIHLKDRFFDRHRNYVKLLAADNIVIVLDILGNARFVSVAFSNAPSRRRFSNLVLFLRI